MIKAALKSLLGRKVRLLLSTFAIVLGVSFVAGTLIFSDTLNRSFTALFASAVGDVVVRPLGSQTAGGTPSAQTVPANLADRLEQVDGRRPRRRQRERVRRLRRRLGRQGDRRARPAGHRQQLERRTHAGRGRARDHRGRAPQGQDEVLLDERTAERAGYQVGDQIRLLLPRGSSQLRPTLVGLVGFPEGGSLNGATLALFDTRSAQELFLEGRDDSATSG